ncbi:MAG: hypothetical protein ABFS28_16380 [Bacteroidota bacterium]
MDKSKIQKILFTIVTVLLMLSVLSLIAVIPGMLLDKSPGAMPIQAASGAFIGMLIHLALLAYLFGFRLSKHNRPGKREISLVPAIALALLGIMILDGGFAFLEEIPYVSYGMFLVAFCDIAAALVSFAALILMRPKKKK